MLPWPKPPLTKNKRLHYHAEAKVRKQVHRDVMLMALSAKLPKGLGQVKIDLWWEARIERRRDTDNMFDTMKPLIDGLVKYGLVEDDNADHVKSECHVVTGTRDICWMVVTPASW
jgi:Holliday junction resolvase RusA-like endonuclease